MQDGRVRRSERWRVLRPACRCVRVFGSDDQPDALSDALSDALPDALPDAIHDALPDAIHDALPDALPDT